MQYYADYDDNGNLSGFYVDEIHGEGIPGKAIPITEEEWQTYLSNQGKYKVEDGTIREKTQQELDEEAANQPPAPPEPIEQLQQQNAQLLMSSAQQSVTIQQQQGQIAALLVQVAQLQGGAS
ncbi:hypothetical protein [Paenibacillus senegalensis]|uniref:hypothetical protein n=1 Tax=Paenibacillus senegalensis TaxID=1465766 RepID=UPI000288CB56|nr:hypothetical protein [Paenibacillus senegalensis]